MKISRTSAFLAAIIALELCASFAKGALIPGLFNTGVNTNGTLLDAAQIDPHYTLIYSDDPVYPGPNALTINNTSFLGVQFGWMTEGPDSRWIAPHPQQARGVVVGSYVYRTTFDLTGFDPNKARIIGRSALYNWGVDILLNEVSLGISINNVINNHTAFSDFTIASGFVAGTNTIDFVVNNGPSNTGFSPTGLRVEIYGTLELPNEIPLIFKQPEPRKIVRVGDGASLTVLAYGTPPLMYQWRQDGVDVPGATNATLVRSNVNANQEGSYTVVLSNGAGSVTSAAAQLIVLEVIPDLFNTGVGNDRAVLNDLAVDPHYKLVTNPDGPSRNAIVHDSSISVFSGRWVENTGTSKWIAPRGDTAEAAPLNYVYRLEFDLTGFDPATALITGRWATDNEGLDIRLNVISTRNQNLVQSASFSTFTITNGFSSGINKLDFLVFNAGQSPTGLRVDSIAGGAKRSAAVGGAPNLNIVSDRDGMILISWPASVAGFLLESSESLASASWRAENQPVVAAGNRNTVAVAASGHAKFYRLRK